MVVAAVDLHDLETCPRATLPVSSQNTHLPLMSACRSELTAVEAVVGVELIVDRTERTRRAELNAHLLERQPLVDLQEAVANQAVQPQRLPIVAGSRPCWPRRPARGSWW